MLRYYTSEDKPVPEPIEQRIAKDLIKVANGGKNTLAEEDFLAALE